MTRPVVNKATPPEVNKATPPNTMEKSSSKVCMRIVCIDFSLNSIASHVHMNLLSGARITRPFLAVAGGSILISLLPQVTFVKSCTFQGRS